MTHCSEHLKVNTCELKGILCDSLGHALASIVNFCLFCWFDVFGFTIRFWFALGARGCKGRERKKGDEMSGTGMHDVKSTGNQ